MRSRSTSPVRQGRLPNADGIPLGRQGSVDEIAATCPVPSQRGRRRCQDNRMAGDRGREEADGMMELSYRRHVVPPVVIQHAVWLYLRLPRDLPEGSATDTAASAEGVAP